MLILGGRLSNDDGGGEEKDKKAIASIALDWQNKTLHVHHAFLYISLPSLHNYDVKLPSFSFNEGRERQDKDFLFLFLNFDTVVESTPEEFPNIKQIV